MTPTIETGKRAAMLATVGGIGATAALLIAASHTSADRNGFALSLSYVMAKKLWEIATAGVVWAGIFNWLFEKWIWRFSLLQGWLVKIPDLSGVWQGISESRYFKNRDGSFQAIPIEVTIDHRFDRIIYTQKNMHNAKEGGTTSKAVVVDLSTDENDVCTLAVIYRNLPRPRDISNDAPESYSANTRPHDGCMLTTLDRPVKERNVTVQWTLSGEYWTNKSRCQDHQDPGTTGVLNLRWRRRL
jgi:hypothetical protein